MATTTKRPRGRPPMICEKIKLTTRRKTEPFIEKAVVKKCDARAKKAYAPYRCELTKKNKCVTPNVKILNSASSTKKPASPSPLSTASTVKSTKSTKKPVKVIYNELYDKSSSSKKPASPSPLSTASTVKSTKSTTKSSSSGPKKVPTHTVKFYDNPAFSASPKKESVKMRNNPLYSK